MLRRTVRALACLLLGAAGMLAIPPNTPNKDAAISSSGCVRTGVETGCLILKGFKDKKTYSLHFPDKKPDLGTAISFEGSDGGADTCMQGVVVNVTRWTPLKMKCPKDSRTR